MKLTAVILAGGKSSRMGSDKGFTKLNGIPMIEYQIQLFNKIGIPVIIIANKEEYKNFKLPVFSDLIKEKGPLGGIHTALTVSNTENNIIVSCDTPFLSEELIHLLVAHHKNEITIALYKEKKHPLIGIYNKSLTNSALSSITNNNLRMQSFISKHSHTLVPLHEWSNKNFEEEVKNINTQEELKLAEHGK